MKRAALLLLAVCLPCAARAEIPYVYPFNAMTGQEVLDHRLKRVKTQLDYLNREKVDAYLNGIRDAAHGRDWCLATPMLPEELNASVVERLKTAHDPAALKGNAAPLVLAELRQQFPCVKPAMLPARKSATKPATKSARQAAKPTRKQAGKQPVRRKS